MGIPFSRLGQVLFAILSDSVSHVRDRQYTE
jgi:hypothetical protein